MKTFADVRMSEREARKVGVPHERGTLAGYTRILRLPLDDPLLARICEMRQKYYRRGRSFASADLEYEYTEKELRAASLLRVSFNCLYHDDGSEYGTQYDEGSVCQHCGAGRTQLSPLALDYSKMGRGQFQKTLGGDFIVSSTVTQQLQTNLFTGCRLESVLNSSGDIPRAPYFQVVPIEAPVEVIAPTVFGIDYCLQGEPNKYKCPLGHTAGLNLISEAYISSTSWAGRPDIVFSRQRIGVRRGVCFPEPLLMVTPRVWFAIKKQIGRCASVTVVHVE